MLLKGTMVVVSLSAENLELCRVPPRLGVKKPSPIPAWMTCGHHCPNPSHCTYHKASSLASKSPGIGFQPEVPWTPTVPCLKCNSISQGVKFTILTCNNTKNTKGEKKKVKTEEPSFDKGAGETSLMARRNPPEPQEHSAHYRLVLSSARPRLGRLTPPLP